MDLVAAAASSPPAASAKAGRGFTLIELLVVLVIMGLMVGLLSAVIRPDDRGLLRVARRDGDARNHARRRKRLLSS